jgi:outer membrane protein
MTSDGAMSRNRLILVASAAVFCAALAGGAANAETLNGALIKAYRNNPTLNAQRASVRVTDENVPQALSGYRPTVSLDGSIEQSSTRATTPLERRTSNLTSRSGQLTVNQNLFDGFQTRNSVRVGESQVLAQRETLRNTVQNILYDAAEAYMNVLRDGAILELRNNNLQVLEEELRATRERFAVGVVTRTDVAQAESSVAGARSEISSAQAILETSKAVYRQVIGDDPRNLAPGKLIDSLLPRALPAAIDLSYREHPAIKAALHGVDAAQLQVRVIEGQLLPTVSLQGALAASRQPQTNIARSQSASITGVLSIPLYEGGLVYSQARQAKESAGQVRIEADVTRDQVRSAAVQAFSTLESARAQTISAQAQVDAATVALAGVREEARVGERTTLDVLQQQQILLDAQTLLVQAQRDRIVASYALLAAVGRLSVEHLKLGIQTYDPSVHYNQVRDEWIGLRTPDGR